MPSMRVAVDLTMLEPPAVGLTRAPLALRFVGALLQHAPETEFVLLTNSAIHLELAHLDAPNASRLLVHDPSPLEKLMGRLERRVRRSRVGNRLNAFTGRSTRAPRPGGLRNLRADAMLCPFLPSGAYHRSVPLVATVHDLQHLSHPYLLTPTERSVHAQSFVTIRQRAARIVCSSASVSQETLQSERDVSYQQVSTLAPGNLLVQPAVPASLVAETLAQHQLEENGFLLFVADFEPRHNHRLALTAFSMFRARQPGSHLRLVCVGGPRSVAASFETVAADMGLKDSVQFPSALDNEHTTALMQSCRAMLVPSLYETIADSMLSAMRFGRPVLCSRIADLVALTDGSALTFDPHRPTELAETCERLEAAVSLPAHLGRLARERAMRLDDAPAVAQAYLSVLRDTRTACPTSR